jgi:hypothetical protein
MKKPPAIPVLSIVGFAALGLFSFGLACVLLLLRPDSLSGDPVRGSVQALTHLITLGWIGSLLFAGSYLYAPTLAESPLWSRRLPSVHFALHALGLAVMLGGLVTGRADLAGLGAALLFLGLTVLIFNLLITAGRRSVWTPSNIVLQTALFWLAVTGALALYMLRNRATGESFVAQETLIALHAHFALFGFLVQALLGVSLRIAPELLGRDSPRRSYDSLAWLGWISLNSGLFLLVPATVSGIALALVAAGGMIALGVAAFAGHLACSLWIDRRAVSWGAITHATGVVLLLAIVAAALWRLPQVATGSMEATREWIRLYISLALLGPFAFAILGTGERLIPRLVWQLRFGPWADRAKVPSPQSLSREAAGAPAFFALLVAWIYLALGQWLAEPDAIRLGAGLMLVGFAWFLVSIAPAIARLTLGVTPDDLALPPPATQPATPATPSSLPTVR